MSDFPFFGNRTNIDSSDSSGDVVFVTPHSFPFRLYGVRRFFGYWSTPALPKDRHPGDVQDMALPERACAPSHEP